GHQISHSETYEKLITGRHEDAEGARYETVARAAADKLQVRPVRGNARIIHRPALIRGFPPDRFGLHLVLVSAVEHEGVRGLKRGEHAYPLPDKTALFGRFCRRQAAPAAAQERSESFFLFLHGEEGPLSPFRECNRRFANQG